VQPVPVPEEPTVPTTPTVCRTAVVLAFLLALAVAGRPGWAASSLALCLVAVWLAPVLTGHRAVAPAAAAPEPSEAPAG
jgi:hypothetical protein